MKEKDKYYRRYDRIENRIRQRPGITRTELNWETGVVEQAWIGLPMLHGLRLADDLILGYELGGEMVAIRTRP